jgi:hypothetical protein
MTEHYFGATQATLFLSHEVLAVPVSRVRCSRCVTGPRLEYITWANSNAAEDEKLEAAALLTILVEWDHPQHGPVGYGGMTIEELRKRVGRSSARAAGA